MALNEFYVQVFRENYQRSQKERETNEKRSLPEREGTLVRCQERGQLFKHKVDFHRFVLEVDI